MSLEDLASHTSTRVDPISINYKGFTVWECPPNGQGITALIALGILESLQENGVVKDLGDMKHNSAEYLHAVIESLRLAFEDSKYYVTDPDIYPIPVKELLSKRASLFDPKMAKVDVERGSPENSSDTVYFSIVDEEGNACSYINSNYHGFGTGAVPEDCGFSLHGRGAGFVLKEGHPNCLEPNKRPYHTIIPSLVTKNQDLWLTFGGHVQVLLNLIHHQFNPQVALDAPRIMIEPFNKESRSLVYAEEGIDKNAIRELQSMGHNLKEIKDWKRSVFGRGQIIERRIDQNSQIRVWCGGSDPRGDGQVIGW
ncbi:13909_t:CDS:2 [Acaulospora morrowiae]|uniref:13909_t:CDS:1 n=1 Tax=Acaulospora morrowiae TaxID=94023 RepID=A0A9N8YPD0_9GLOM|nr:13909_t:CDS:2 [Acaulospora morrowiae]